MEIIVNGSPIYYEERGEGTPVLCIHGFPEDHRAMVGCLERVFHDRQGYRRIYVDLPGMGRSPVNQNVENADDMLGTVEQFIKQVIGGDDFLLIGQSYGGYLSLGLAMRAPERIGGIFFLCPCVLAERSKRTLPPKRTARREEISLLAEDNWGEFEEFLELAMVATEATWGRYKQEILPGLLCADGEFVQRYQGTGYSFSFEEKLGEIRFEKPVSFLLGRQDDCVGYQDAYRLLDCFPRASFGVADGAGHNLQIEQPGLFETSVLEWLDRVQAHS